MTSKDLNYKNKYEHIKEQFDIFSYGVSHDLNTPLRHIREFTKILMSTIDDITDEQKEAIDFITKAVRQSEQMIEGLLTYSRLNTLKKPFYKFNAEHLFIYANTALSELIEEKKGVINLPEKLPDIIGDLEQLSNMTTYLIENSLKFVADDKIPQIDIDIKEEDENLTITFKDNGIGINEKYFNDVFLIFKKLDPETSGIGIGLTLTDKIIERHNGKIRLESEIGQGTSFYVSIPKHQEKKR